MQKISYLPHWREKFLVRSYDIGLTAKMRMSMVCSYFQEIAGRHAKHLDIGYQQMQLNGKVWVLSRIYMNIHKMPGWGQEFFAETWPLGIERIFYRRDYRLDDGNETMITACSYWLLLDLKTRRPTTMPIDEEVLKANAGQFSMPMPNESFQPVKAETKEIHRVKYSDLDQNHHVNNARYVEWIFDLIDQSMLEEKTPSFFSIEYKHEVKSGDSVNLKIAKSENDTRTFLIEGIIQETNQTCFRAKLTF